MIIFQLLDVGYVSLEECLVDAVPHTVGGVGEGDRKTSQHLPDFGQTGLLLTQLLGLVSLVMSAVVSMFKLIKC